MCGRYVFFDGKNERIQKLVESAKQHFDQKKFDQIALGEVFPGCTAFIALATSEGMRTRLMKWGFSSAHGLVINARSETAFTSRFFAGCVPCAAIATAYFEWSPKHEKYGFFTDQTMYLAALARKEKEEWHYVILTEEAGNGQKEIHPRQPVVFSYENAKKWCASTQPTSLLSVSIQKRKIYKA